MSKTQLTQRQNRTSPKRVLGAVVAITIAFLLLASVIGLAEKYMAIRGRVSDLKGQQKQLSTKQVELKEKNNYIETREGEERELRSKYNVVKPGEEMVIITNSSPDSEEGGPTTRIGRWWESLMKGLGLRKE